MLLLLAFFAAGTALGLIAMLGTYLSQRREVARLEKKVSIQDSKPQFTGQPPAAEG